MLNVELKMLKLVRGTHRKHKEEESGTGKQNNYEATPQVRNLNFSNTHHFSTALSMSLTHFQSPLLAIFWWDICYSNLPFIYSNVSKILHFSRVTSTIFFLGVFDIRYMNVFKILHIFKVRIQRLLGVFNIRYSNVSLTLNISQLWNLQQIIWTEKPKSITELTTFQSFPAAMQKFTNFHD